jgi:hypothetical protein
MADPKPKYASVNPSNPEAWGQCDECGFWYNLRELGFQMEWAGTHLYNTGSLRCPRCLDVPQEQFRTIILPPDPPPIFNSRVPNFAYEEQTVRITQRAGAPGTAFAKPKSQPPWNAGPQRIRCLQGALKNIPRIIQLNTSS